MSILQHLKDRHVDLDTYSLTVERGRAGGDQPAL